MKILIVIDTLASGGMQIQLLNLLPGLLKSGHKITLLAYNAPSSEDFYEEKVRKLDINLIKLEGRKGFKFDVLNNLRNIINNDQYELLLSFMPRANLYVTIAKLLSRFKTRHIRHICVDMSILTRRNPISIWGASFFSHMFCDVMICNSITQVNLYKKILRSFSKAKFIANGIDIDHYKNNEESWPHDLNNFIVIGRITEAKNGPNFVKALQLLSKKIEDPINVSWVGRVDSDAEAKRDKRLMDELISLIPSSKISWNWIGEVSDTRPYYHQASCLIIPSKWEGVPNVLIEAMLSGCLVISTDISDLGSILDYGKRGIVSKGSCPDEIANAINKYLALGKNDVFAMRRLAQQYAIEHFSIEKMANSYIKLFK